MITDEEGNGLIDEEGNYIVNEIGLGLGAQLQKPRKPIEEEE